MLMDTNEPWHLSRSVPVTLDICNYHADSSSYMVCCFLSSEVEQNKMANAKQDAKIDSLEKIVQNQAVTMGRMDENIKAIRQMMEKDRYK